MICECVGIVSGLVLELLNSVVLSLVRVQQISEDVLELVK